MRFLMSLIRPEAKPSSLVRSHNLDDKRRIVRLLPADFLPIMLIEPRAILPAGYMYIHKLPILMGPCLLHNIHNFLSSNFYRQICVRATKVGA